MKGYNAYTVIVEDVVFSSEGNPVILIDGVCEQNGKKIRVPLTADLFKFQIGMDISTEMEKTAKLMQKRAHSEIGLKLPLHDYQSDIANKDGIDPFNSNFSDGPFSSKYKDKKFFDDKKFKYSE